MGKPSVGGGVPELVRMEAFDPGKLGTPSQGAAEAVVSEARSTLTEPNFGGVGLPVVLTKFKIGVERTDGGGSDRNDPSSPALAASDGDQIRGEVDVARTHAISSPARMPVSSMSRMMASSRR